MRPFRLRLILLLLAGTLLLAGCGGSDSDSERVGDTEATGQLPATGAEDTTQAGATPAGVLPDLSGPAGNRLRREVARANQAGMLPNVFAKVGDSNTEWAQNLYGLGCREVVYGEHGDLEPVVRRYTQRRFPALEPYTDCEPTNSLSRRSAATVSGVWTEWLMTPVAELPETGISHPTGECAPDQTPLDCEIRLLSPRWALIMTGTNDALLGMPLGDTYRGLLEDMIDRVRQLGPVPVLSTLPPMPVPAHNGEPGDERIAEANRIIESVAKSRGVPLIDLHAALSAPGMVNEGIAPDGLHLGVHGGEMDPEILANSAVLTPEALEEGANRRNLIWLQVLQRLDRAAGVGS